MRLDRIMIAATSSGSGKTTITCGILKSLKKMGENVISFKCGPDYIDPMYHEKVLGVSSRNLDTFFTGEETTRKIMADQIYGDELAVIEGVMGLFDGLGGVREEGSSYHLARVTKTPIVLVVNAKGMGRSVIPLIAGFLSYDTGHLIKGVILNRMSKGAFEILAPIIKDELNIEVLGYYPEQKDLVLESRHLGLMIPDEIKDMQKNLEKISQKLQETIDISRLIRIAESSEKLSSCEKSDFVGVTENEAPLIAVAKDEAFCFYYQDNFKLLKHYGARIQFFSILHDKQLPPGTDGLLIGGGYPELYLQELSSNLHMKSEIRKAFNGGMPVVAECGGFMYLHEMIEDENGDKFDMAGVIPGTCRNMGKTVRFGYIEVREKNSNYLPANTGIRGHEFHYFDSSHNGDDCIAVKPASGKSYGCIIDKKNLFLGFPHLYYPSNPVFAENFVKKTVEYHRNKR